MRKPEECHCNPAAHGIPSTTDAQLLRRVRKDNAIRRRHYLTVSAEYFGPRGEEGRAGLLLCLNWGDWQSLERLRELKAAAC